jgi:hypothetical protein
VAPRSQPPVKRGADVAGISAPQTTAPHISVPSANELSAPDLGAQLGAMVYDVEPACKIPPHTPIARAFFHWFQVRFDFSLFPTRQFSEHVDGCGLDHCTFPGCKVVRRIFVV